MIENYQKAEIAPGLFFEHDPDQPDIVKVSMGNNKAIVKKEDLYSFLIIVADDAMRDKLMPVRQTTLTRYEKTHRVQARTDIKKGEFINVRCEISVPTVIEEGIQATLGKKKHILTL